MLFAGKQRGTDFVKELKQIVAGEHLGMESNKILKEALIKYGEINSMRNYLAHFLTAVAKSPDGQPEIVVTNMNLAREPRDFKQFAVPVDMVEKMTWDSNKIFTHLFVVQGRVLDQRFPIRKAQENATKDQKSLRHSRWLVRQSWRYKRPSLTNRRFYKSRRFSHTVTAPDRL